MWRRPDNGRDSRDAYTTEVRNRRTQHFPLTVILCVTGKRLRGCVLTCFQWFPTFVFQNPNESKNGDKRNGHISSGRKTI